MTQSIDSPTSVPRMWGAPNSAFSAKLRCFFIKSGLEFVERYPVEPGYSQEIVPRIGYPVVPVTELSDGTILQDSTETMFYFEREHALKRSLIPNTPVLEALAYFLTFIGSDGFLKPGMHYRWSFLREQKTYLESAFIDWLPSADSAAQNSERLAGIMTFFNEYLPKLGVTENTIEAIESSWAACLGVLNEHFSACPYLLGGAPSIADCGLMTMLGPHLSRDPVPGYLMRTRAPMVARWAERMNRHDAFDGGFAEVSTEFSTTDEVPPTLLPFLSYLAVDILPEITATIERFNVWVSEELPTRSDGSLDDPNMPTAHPDCGEINYSLRGQSVSRLGFIDTVYQYQQVLSQLDSLPGDTRTTFDTLMDKCGASSLAKVRPNKTIRYTNYRYFLE